MEITSMTELEKRTLAEISEAIYGEELTRIMLPELKEYLNSYSSIERDGIA
jgi:effector-binding domain-containing protein